MELVRKILVEVEALTDPRGAYRLTFDGFSDEEISYHIQLLAKHGLIEAVDYSTRGEFCWLVRNLKWDGHDFIDAIRDDSRWNRAKQWVADAGKTLTLESLKLAVKALF